MDKFVLSSDSCCDLLKSEFEGLRLNVLPLTFIIEKGGCIDSLKDDFNSISEYEKFYDDIAGGMTAKTSQLTMKEHEEYFLSLIDKYKKDILHITLSSGLSGTYDQAVMAAKHLHEKHPDYKVYVVDSKSATVGQGILTRTAAKMRDDGKSAEETREHLLSITKGLNHWIMVDDLNHLKRGGRISGAKAAIGTLLNLKPSIIINHEGRLAVVGKERGLQKAINNIVKMVEKYSDDRTEEYVVVHTKAYESATALKEAVSRATGKPVLMQIMGPVIGAHLGPGAIACAFVGKKRPEVY